MCPFGFVQLKCRSHSLKYGVGDAADAAAFQPRVVVRAHPGELCHFLTAQARHAAQFPYLGIPACSGLTFARREIRNSRMSSFLSTSTTLRSPFGRWQCLSDTPNMLMCLVADQPKHVIEDGGLPLAASAEPVGPLPELGIRHERSR